MFFLNIFLDGTQPFNIIPSSLYQHDDGNLRYQTNNSDLIKSRLSNGRLNDNRDLSIERGIYHNRAAAKIQAAYRGYTVRKSLPRFNEKEKHLHDEFNKRVKKKQNSFLFFKYSSFYLADSLSRNCIS